jgi:hypothetical protein
MAYSKAKLKSSGDVAPCFRPFWIGKLSNVYKCNCNDEVQEDDMGKAYSMNGDKEKCIQSFVGKNSCPLDKRPHHRI